MSWHPDGSTTDAHLCGAWQRFSFGASAADMLCIVAPDTNASYYGRDPDDAAQFNHADGGSSHGIGASVGGESGLIAIPSDASGDIEISPGFLGPHTMRLIGTLDKTDDGQVLVNAASIASGSWDTHQITSLAAGGGCALLRCTQATGNNKRVSVRPSDLTAAAQNTRSYVYKRNCWIAAGDINDVAYVLAVTDSTGHVDLRSYSVLTAWTVTVVCTVDDFVLARTEFDSWVTADQNYHARSTGAPGDSFCAYLARTTDVLTDHNVYVSEDSATFSTKINSGLTGISSGYRRFNELTQAVPLFSPIDSSSDVDVAIVGTTGKTWAIDLLGYVISNIAPVCTWTSPSGGGIIPGATISGTTTDADGTIDPAQTQVTITHDPLGTPTAYNAIVNGVVQAGFTGSCTAAGWSVTKDGGMYPGTWSSSASCQDDVGSSDTDTGSWTVAWSTPPGIDYEHPADYAPEPSMIRFSVTDDYGIDPATLSITAVETVSGERVSWPAVTLGVVEDGWDAVITYTGATPTRIDVVIRGWPLDLSGVYRRVEMVVDATSSTGVPM